MKKLILIFAAFALLTTSAFAEGFLIKGGLTYGNVASKGIVKELKNLDFKSYTGFHAGIGYQTRSFAGFSFQPELQYNQKGTKNEVETIKLHYLELPVNVQWGIDLLVVRPFIMVSPYVGCCLGGQDKIAGSKFKMEDLKDRLEYGFGLGAGINIHKFQIAAKYSWNFGKVSGFDVYWDMVTDSKKTNGALEISAAFVF